MDCNTNRGFWKGKFDKKANRRMCKNKKLCIRSVMLSVLGQNTIVDCFQRLHFRYEGVSRLL